MLLFPSQDEIEVFVIPSGQICFKSTGAEPKEVNLVYLTIGQFRTVIKNSENLIAEADAKRRSLL